MTATARRQPGLLRDFVRDFTHLVDRHSEESMLLAEGAILLKRLIDQDGWLPGYCAQSNPQRYQQYLLHCDPLERFSLVSFVWDGGQATPVHNHTVWGLVGVLRGAEISTDYRIGEGGSLVAGEARRLTAGDVVPISPLSGDIHQVRNAFADRPSISIHVYGGNIGRVQRTIFRDADRSEFVSGYSNATLPNIWGCS